MAGKMSERGVRELRSMKHLASTIFFPSRPACARGSWLELHRFLRKRGAAPRKRDFPCAPTGASAQHSKL
jgi:hypothetical protein